MPPLHRVTAALAAMVVAATAGREAAAQSIGCMRLPSTVGQYFGYGYGAGHHAPIVRTPHQEPQRIARRTFAPPWCGPLQPLPYEPAGCYGPAGCAGAGTAYGGGWQAGPPLGAAAGMPASVARGGSTSAIMAAPVVTRPAIAGPVMAGPLGPAGDPQAALVQSGAGYAWR